ncbi:alpha-glucosidase [Vulcanibacillus modesticaldus]|uniref:Alpha-glucosidase n=2 Tax=Vulcanibacillus modesticaldus TaxID=337097 RepID=A0A1D2YWM2_9BACI|nr:glycoside hydrolase family 31 protein [Vulcanibacillus modesticaldus]OEG00104.1 alpha-glucosidase [Vulcanibacillus modesticaldus]
MKDTSFAIHPGTKKTIDNDSYYDIGNLIAMKNDDKIIRFTCEQGYVNIKYYRDDIVRITMNPYQEPLMESTFAVVLDSEDVSISVTDKEDEVILKSSKLTTIVKKAPFRITVLDQDGKILVEETKRGMGYNDKKEVICFKSMDEADHFYGFGEKTSFLDKRGEKMTMFNSDVYAPHNPETDPLYQSIPYFMTLRDGRAHGIYFDNSYKTTFDLKTNKDTYSFSAEGGQLDYYVLAGPTPKDVLEQYTALTGRMPIPPKWAIGYHQSRYSYETEQEVRELVKTFLDKEIPLDVVYLDIHYMNGYRVFTFDNSRFPSIDKLVKDMKDVGIRIVPIVDPGVKEDPEYHIFQEGVREDHFCKYIDGKIYYGDVWPGNSAFPDFINSEVRKWWGEKHRFYSELGIEGIWNDMNEPAVFNETKTMDLKVIHDKDGELKTHREMHNMYGFMMGEATYQGMKKLLKGKRPFLLTRAGFAGIQRYAAVWTGDNRSFWEHLAMAIPMCLNLGVSGVAFSGTDVGGFAHDCNGELLARWTQVGAFTPFFRNHTVIDSVRQEPWAFGEEYGEIIKKYIQLRYIWLPHLYKLFVETSRTGLPVMRPLFMEYPDDKNTFNLSDQFMIGDNVIIAPILQPNTYHRVVYLPEGKWYDYWTDESIEGGKHILVEAELDKLPIFVREGSIITHGPVKQSTMVPADEIIVHLYPKQSGVIEYTLYDDDGETFSYQNGEYLEKKITCDLSDDRIDVAIEDVVANYQPTWKKMVLKVHDTTSKLNVFVNQQKVAEDQISFDEETKVSSITLK